MRGLVTSVVFLIAAASIILGTAASALITLGALDTPGSARDVEVVGDLAYVADGSSGLRIIDVSNPTVSDAMVPGATRSQRVKSDRRVVSDRRFETKAKCRTAGGDFEVRPLREKTASRHLSTTGRPHPDAQLTVRAFVQAVDDVRPVPGFRQIHSSCISVYRKPMKGRVLRLAGNPSGRLAGSGPFASRW